MTKYFACLLLALFLSGVGSVSAEHVTLNPADIGALVPIGFAPGEGFVDVSPDGTYAVLKNNAGPGLSGYDAVVVNRVDGSVAMPLERTLGAVFRDDSHLLWTPALDSQSVRIYDVPTQEEYGRFPLGIRPTPRVYGEGYFYTVDSAVLFQDSDFSIQPRRIAGGLGYTQGYRGAAAELPDSYTMLIAGNLSMGLYDLESGAQVGKIDYPLGQAVSFSADGSRLSAMTNYDVFSSQASIWLAYDLLNEQVLVELFGQKGAHGVISDSGSYGAASQQITDSGIGKLRLYNLDNGDEIMTMEGIAHGAPGSPYFLFVGDRLVYLRDWDGRQGLVSIFDPADGLNLDTSLVVYYLPQRLSDSLVQVYLSSFDLNNRFGIVDVSSGELLREFPTMIDITAGGRMMIAGAVLYGLPEGGDVELPTLTGTTTNANINVRAAPSTNAARVNGATGAIVALARNRDSTWVYLTSHAGWVSTDLVTLDGDIGSLTVKP